MLNITKTDKANVTSGSTTLKAIKELDKELKAANINFSATLAEIDDVKAEVWKLYLDDFCKGSSDSTSMVPTSILLTPLTRSLLVFLPVSTWWRSYIWTSQPTSTSLIYHRFWVSQTDEIDQRLLLRLAVQVLDIKFNQLDLPALHASRSFYIS